MFTDTEKNWMTQALRLARQGLGRTSPNPMVGALLVRRGKIIGQGWHHGPGLPHAEVNAIQNAQAAGHPVRGATLVVTLEPCSSHGRTPPCTDAILHHRIRDLIVAAPDPNPVHAGRGFHLLQSAGIPVRTGLLADQAEELNEAFNHWIQHRTPWVVAKAALTLDGKIATATGQSKWITSPSSRAFAMKLRKASDAILVGWRTIQLDDPRLTWRASPRRAQKSKPLRRIILDPLARTPPHSQILSPLLASDTTIYISPSAPTPRAQRLSRLCTVNTVALSPGGGLDLPAILADLGTQEVTQLLVEGGGRTLTAFFNQKLAHRVAFFYGPVVIGDANASKALGGRSFHSFPTLHQIRWRRIGHDLFLSARL